MKKRILSSFLSLVLVLSLMPVSALAAEGPQNMAPAVVTEEPGEVHGEPPAGWLGGSVPTVISGRPPFIPGRGRRSAAVPVCAGKVSPKRLERCRRALEEWE